ncbi:hypothetical protein DRP04_02650 [Archaeoglobales archaeon]|nr:MAG: hypothetical protein DRP04_02650 [Archaeoglobales archaeon]HDN74285.1 hypothetical protein [Archaeoglobus sp.]
MKSPIYFKSKKALDYLLKNGSVYTIRKSRRKEGLAWVMGENRRKIADAIVEYIGEVVLTEPDSEWWVTKGAYGIAKLEEFVKKSGFSSVEEWLDEVKRLNNGSLPEKMYLYHVTLVSFDKRLEIFDKEYTQELADERDRPLKGATLILIKVKCIATDRWRHFLLLAFPPSENDIVPKFMIYVDERCAYCGELLKHTEEPVKCVLCGREFTDKARRIVCENGHYICGDCYFKTTEKLLLMLTLDMLFRHYHGIKEYIKESLKRGSYKNLSPAKAKSILFRNAVTLVLRHYADEISEKIGTRVEVTALTNVFVPNIEEIVRTICLDCKNKCPAIKELLKDLGGEIYSD